MNMQPIKVMESLENLAEKLGVEIVYEKLGDEEFSVRGGLCKVQKTYKIFMTRSEPVDSQIKILVRALSSFNTEDIYLLPFIREILEMARKKEGTSLIPC
ncbi:MAG: hypothetical protein HY739_07545 [Desulfobacterales bacterium]|nr:hypothetical protein [Desulfobacterales bacterium]